VLDLTVVDTFTSEPFRGNPAAVAVLDATGGWPEETRMQHIAREMALSETAFVRPLGGADFDLRWFTPTVEVDLCGHATLASAHVVGSRARFRTRSGLLACSPGPGGLIQMDFPLDAPEPVTAPLEWPGALGWYRGRFDLLVEMGDAVEVRSLLPDLKAVAALDCRGVIVTAAGDRPGIDCVSRFFAPQSGVPEDPVTGSAHCSLAPFWAGRIGRNELVGEQVSDRGGTVYMRCSGDRVVLGGHAVTVSQVRMVV